MTARRWFALAAATSTVVAVVFLTVGDGVSAGDAVGVRRIVLDHGHTLTWILLAAAFWCAAAQGRWSRAAGGLALAAAASYVVFLISVLAG